MVQNKSGLSLTSRKSSFFNVPTAPPQEDVFYVGVDVGTGSARACVIDTNGVILGLAEKPITRHELKSNHITQSSTEIWNAISYCVKSVIRDSGVDPSEVFGIGFDATCSLVAINEEDDSPVGVGPEFSDNKENIILWMDHRADDETDAINATGDKCLKYVGGQMSIEMELPKIKWLKHNAPNGIKNTKFYDLPDYLTHKATGSEARSYCSTVCKQGFLPLGVENSETGWSEEFLNSVDLPELVENDFKKLGGTPKTGTWLSAGEKIGNLTEEAAEDLGLTTHCIVGSAVIDAYAGWVGTVAAKIEIPGVKVNSDVNSFDAACGRLAAVAGTSTCHIAMTKEACFVQGVWGPYKDVMAPGYWLAEGGQSCTGALLAHVLANHPANQALYTQAEASNISRFDYLNQKLENLVEVNKSRSVVSLAKHWFFYGDFHGNRSPVADPRMRASIIGASMDTSVDDLAIQYFAACEFIAQQTRQIVEEMEKAGHDITYICMSGGQCRNGLLMRLLADCTGLPIVIPRYIDAAVVFGSAILGAVAAEEEVNSHISGNRKDRNFKSNSKSEIASSPYTAPSASASGLNMASLAYTLASNTNLTPMQEENDYFNQSVTQQEKKKEDSDSEEEQTLSFGSQQNHQKDVSNKLAKLGIKPLTKSQPKKSIDGLWKVMQQMTGPGRVVMPSSKDHPDRKLLNAKYEIFLDQCYKQRDYRKLVDKVEAENFK